MSDVKIRAVAGQKGIASFTAQLNAFDDRVRDRLTQVIQSIAFIIAEAIIVGNQYGPGTPVDTGFARANWVMAINDEPAGTLVDRPAGHVAFPAADTTIPGTLGLGDIFRMANNAVYAYSLEMGHSQQAPTGMVRIVIAAGQTIVNDLIGSLPMPQSTAAQP
jgi:hypothetical protein